jgi:hypothetical protein
MYLQSNQVAMGQLLHLYPVLSRIFLFPVQNPWLLVACSLHHLLAQRQLAQLPQALMLRRAAVHRL